jgi:hypothetical protein
MNASTIAMTPHTVAIAPATLARSATYWAQCGEAADAVDGGVEPVQKARRVVEAVVVDRGQDQLRGGARVGGLVGGG